MHRLQARRAILMGFATGVCVLLAGEEPLYAQGRPHRGAVHVARDRLQEHDRAWRLLMRLRLPRPPDNPEVRLRFSFTQVAELHPGPDPDHPREVPVDSPRVLRQEQVVDTRDLRGNPGVRARAELQLRKDDGFSAGIWLLDVEAPDGPIGERIRLTLLGSETAPDGGAPDGGT